MNTYDQLALSAFPTLYLASPSTLDQSNSGEYTLSGNNLSLTGQPIINGHLNSFYVTDTNSVTIEGDLGFFTSENSVEFVMYCVQPEQEFPVIKSNSNSGVFVDQNHIIFRLHFEDSDNIIYAIDAKYRVNRWNSKFHVLIYFNNNDAQLIVNGQLSQINYIHNPVVPTEFVLQTTAGNWVNIDGLSTFNRRSPDKLSYIDDLNNGHSIYSTSIVGGNYTLFDTSTVISSQSYTIQDFVRYGENEYVLTVTSPPEIDISPAFIVVKIDKNNTGVLYKTNLMNDWQSLGESIAIDNTPEIQTISFLWAPNEIVADILIDVEYVENGKIDEHSPAILELTGQSIFFDTQDSLVNVPNGIKLIDSYYTGTWIVGNDVDIPLSVEIIFKPETIDNDTYVFYSDDGHASFGPTGSISGYTAYLNGVLVTELNVLVGQIYHLILKKSAPTAETFFLNYNGTDTSSISYILISSYQSELSVNNALSLVNVLCGADKIAFEESINFLDEGQDIDTGIAYNPYSYAWSIVGAGGH